MAQLHLDSTDSDSSSTKTALVVFFTTESDESHPLDTGPLTTRDRDLINGYARILDFKAAAGQTAVVPHVQDGQEQLFVFTAVSDRSDEEFRRAAGAAVRALPKGWNATLETTAENASAVAEGALLGAYRPGPAKDGDEAVEITLHIDGMDDDESDAIVAEALVVARAVNETRDLVNASPRDLYPQTFVEHAQQVTADLPLDVTVWDEAQLIDHGFGGITAVGQGSTRPPRLVKVDYQPQDSTTHIAIIGKGITFDSGGLSLKPANAMGTMKLDMAGAAAALHTVVAAAQLGLQVHLTAWLALAENMPSGTAQRPSDVITIRGGKTVEVLNTDAEGRLVMADALVAASEEKPDILLDVATLTGAQMVALGNRVSGVMGTEDIRSEFVTAAHATGEQFWPMPLPAELRESMKTPMADIANIGDRFGGMLVAGLFLKEFTAGIPWAHLDIAGPAFNESAAYGYTPKGGTGVAVRALLEFARGRAHRD